MNAELTQLFWPFGIFVILLFIAGIYCIMATFNLMRAIIGLEILIKAVTLLICVVGYITGNVALTQAVVITLIVIEVVIMVVAGGIILSAFKYNRTIDTRKLSNLKG
ncbi:MAG: NADH-quinone oxidoreductase subunit K [Candidatus Omnitrophica bacterium]|nr:NADH-quinone oxidoreductase subunit K [Candidatus Omnitrophota bacterium]